MKKQDERDSYFQTNHDPVLLQRNKKHEEQKGQINTLHCNANLPSAGDWHDVSGVSLIHMMKKETEARIEYYNIVSMERKCLITKYWNIVGYFKNHWTKSTGI